MYIAPTTTLITKMVPTTMGAAGDEALGDVASFISDIGAGIQNYYNQQKAAGAPNPDLQAALLAQQQAAANDHTTLYLGAAALGAAALIYFKMRKKKGR